MAKYTEQFKLDVVQQYLAGNIGHKAIAKQRGLPGSMVRRWVNLYKSHGAAGLTRKFATYSATQKLAVLRHMWAKELSYGQAAAVFNIRSPGHISIWERCYHSGGIDALMPRQRGRPKKMSDSQPAKPALPIDDDTRTREELLAEVNHLRMENAYLKKLDALVQTQQKQRAIVRKKRK